MVRVVGADGALYSTPVAVVAPANLRNGCGGAVAVRGASGAVLVVWGASAVATGGLARGGVGGARLGASLG